MENSVIEVSIYWSLSNYAYFMINHVHYNAVFQHICAASASTSDFQLSTGAIVGILLGFIGVIGKSYLYMYYESFRGSMILKLPSTSLARPLTIKHTVLYNFSRTLPKENTFPFCMKPEFCGETFADDFSLQHAPSIFLKLMYVEKSFVTATKIIFSLESFWLCLNICFQDEGCEEK